MITLQRIEIVNIRAIGNAVIEPLVDGGMTALNGPNGAGKSSILAALLWALYGVTPDGVPVKAMRRQGSDGECRVTVVFTHDGQTIEVTRELKGSKDSTIASIKVDGVETTNVTVRTANNWVKARFGGLDADGFMTAFVVRQKELDGLVKAPPSERRALFERLAGVDRMSTALKSAREKENEVKKRLEVLPGSADDVKAAEAALEAAQVAAVELWEAFEVARDAAQGADAELAEAEAAATAVRERVEAHRQARDAAGAARHQASLTAERAQGAAREAQRLAEAARGGDEATVQAARAAFTEAQERLQAATSAAQRAQQARQVAQQERARADRLVQRADADEREVARLRDTADEARRKADAFPSDLDAQIAKAQAEADEAGQQRGELRSEHQRLTASIAALQANHDPACPTCASPLADPSALLETLTTALQRVLVEGAKSKEVAEAAAAKVQRLTEQARAAAQVKQEAKHAVDQVTAAVERAAAARAEATEAAASATAAEEQAAAVVEEARAVAGRIDELRAAADSTGQALRRAESAAEAAQALPAAQQAAQAAQAAVVDAEARAVELEQAEVAARVPAAEQERAQAALAQAQVKAREAGRVASEADTAAKVAAERVNGAERHRDAERMKLTARVEAVAELERKTAVREALDEFRKDRIARIAPELSEVATDFVSRMTDGKYVSVVLDEEFTPIVTDDTGLERPVAWLSGGEESAVALALRVALGELIAGQRGGLLWMDEALTAQDAQRRPAMMAAIRDLPGRQVITINHTSEATDMVDLVLDVVPDAEHGSRVVPANPYGAVDEALLDMDDVVTADPSEGREDALV